MANTDVTVKRQRVPRTPKPKVEEPEINETVLEKEQTPEVLSENQPVEEVFVGIPEEINVEKSSEPEIEELNTSVSQTEIYLLRKGEKYLVFKDNKRLSRNPVCLEKAKLIAAGYGESNPTIK